MTTLASTPTQTRHGHYRQMAELLGLMYYPEWDAVLDAATGDVKEIAIFGGVRGTKSTIGAFIFFLLVLRQWNTKPGLFWIIGATYQAAEKEFTYLFEWCKALGLVQKTNQPANNSWQLVLKDGTVVETRSSEHVERLASDATDACLVVEAAQQRPGVRSAARQRNLEKNGISIFSGTFEDADKQQYVWFEKMADREDEENIHVACFTLPSWTNRFIFPGGFEDPKIQWAYEHEDEYTFWRKYGGKPGGAQFPIYHALQGNDDRLVEMPASFGNSPSKWMTSVGGSDYGTVHPSALVVVSVSVDRVRLKEKAKGEKPGPFDEHVVWVRECSWDGDRSETSGERGDPRWLKEEKRRLQLAYPGLHMWITDPNERYMAKTWNGKAAATGAGSRGVRIGMVASRLTNWTLYYDRAGEGVEGLYRESQGCRYKVMPDGSKQVFRIDDDRTAAKENAVWGVDTRPPAPPRRAKATLPAGSAAGGWRSV